MTAARARAKGGGSAWQSPQTRSGPSRSSNTRPQQLHKGLATHLIRASQSGQTATAAVSPTGTPQNRHIRGRKNSRRLAPKYLSQAGGTIAMILPD